MSRQFRSLPFLSWLIGMAWRRAQSLRGRAGMNEEARKGEGGAANQSG